MPPLAVVVRSEEGGTVNFGEGQALKSLRNMQKEWLTAVASQNDGLKFQKFASDLISKISFQYILAQAHSRSDRVHLRTKH